MELLNSRLEELDDISRDLSEDIRADSPASRLLSETMRAMQINKNWQFDSTIDPQPPSRETYSGAGISVPPEPGEVGEGGEVKAPAEPSGIVDKATELAEKGADLAGRTGLMVLRGAGEAATNTASTIQDLRLLADELVNNYLPPDVANPIAFHLGLPSSFGGPQAKIGGDKVAEGLNAALDQIVRAPEGKYEETVRDISSVLLAMMPMSKGLQAMGMAAKGASLTAGAAAEAIAVDPNSPSFVDAIGILSPGIRNVVKDFIKADGPDDKAEQDFHDRLRARGFRALTDGVLADSLWNILGKVVKLARGGYKAKAAGAEVLEEVTETGERLALPPGRAQAQPRTVVEEMLKDRQGNLPAVIRPERAGAPTPSGGPPALPAGRPIAGLLPPSSVQVADEALQVIGKYGLESSDENLEIIAQGLGARHNIPQEQARSLIDAGMDLARAAREKVGEEGFSKLAAGLGVGALVAAVVGTDQMISTEDETVMTEQLTSAGISDDVVGGFFKAIKRIVKGTADEDVAKVTLRKQERKIAQGKRLVSDPGGSIIREATEEDAERAAAFLADQPEKVIINGKPHDINFNIIDTPDEFRTTLDRISQLYEPEITAARRTGTSRASETVLAHNMGMSVDQLRDFAQGAELLPRTVVAANEMLVASARRLTSLKDAVLKGDLNSEEAFLNQLVMHGEIQQSVGKIRSEIGRSLGMYNIKVDGTIALMRDAAKGAKGMGKSTGVTAKELAKMYDELTPEQAAKFTRDLTKPTTMGAIYEYWVNGILSASHGVNAAGNVFTTMMAPVERLMAAGVPGSPVQAGEAKEMLYGYIGAVSDAFSLMARNIRTEESAFEGAKFAGHAPQITAELFGLKPDSAVGGAVNMFGKGWRTLGGGLLRASDDAFKLINMRGELRARAYRAAKQQGIEGSAREQFIQKFLNDPPDDALEAAIKARDVLTFSNELSDPTASFQMLRQGGQALNNFTAKQPVLKYLFPFVRASVNVPTYSMERVPGLNLMSSQFRKNLMSSDPELKAQTWAKVGTSAGMLGLVATLSHEGLITGPPPADAQLAKKLADQHGIQWNSIKIGNRWVELNRADPLGWMIASTAELTQLVLGNDNIPEEEQRGLASALLLSNAQMMASKTWMYSAAQAMDAIRGGRYGEGELDAAQRFAGSIMGSFAVPAIVNRLTQQIDPVKREYNVLMDSVKNRIPWLSKEQPAVVNSAGEEVYHTYGYGAGVLDPLLTFALPFSTELVEQPPAVKLLRKHKVNLSLPGNMVDGVNINGEGADPHWVSRYRKLRSKEIKVGGKNLMDSIEAVSKLPVWDRLTDGPDGGKQILVDRLRRRYNEFAKRKLMEEFPELKQKIYSKKLGRMQGIMVPQ